MRSILSPHPTLYLTFAILSKILSVQAQDNYFLAPLGSSVITAGEAYTVRWQPTTPGPVRLQLLYNHNAVFGNLARSIPNNGSFLWTPDNVLAGFNNGSNYFLLICDVTVGSCSSTPNGRFRVVIGSSGSSTTTTTTTVITTTSSISINIPDAGFSTSSTPSSLNSSPTASTSRDTTSSSSLPSSPSADGLPTWAKITVGVVVPIVVLLGIIVFVYVTRLHRQVRNAHQLSHPPAHNSEVQKHESGYNPNARRDSIGNRAELSNREPRHL